MIKQYNITSPQKYNFPNENMDLTLPKRFFEQSLQSLNRLNYQSFQLKQSYFTEIIDTTNFTSKLQHRNTPIFLNANTQNTIIGAVDTSTIKIGETQKGILIAIRGAIIRKHNKKYKYTRIGPFIFHITDKNRNQIYNELKNSCVKINYKKQIIKPNLFQTPIYITSLLERWLQNSLTNGIKNGIILFDGSLTSGINDSPINCIKEILNKARENNNTILAFSKSTKLRRNGYLITDKLPKYEPPFILAATGYNSILPLVLHGDIYIAKLKKTNFAFRLDIDKEVSLEIKKTAVEKLIGNDFLFHGYPETLRLAHVLCTFTANEVVALKHFLTRKHGIRIINRPDMHKILFGPFGNGEIK